MSRSLKRAVGIALIAGMIVGAVLAVRALSTDFDTVGVGTRAPDFSGVTLDSIPRTRTLADYDGDVVLLNIWATWCGPCRVEMPSIQSLHDAYAARGLKVVAISIDAGRGTKRRIREFADSLGLTFEILHDAEGAIKRSYRTSGVPETVIIGRDGVIRKRIVGAVRWDSPSNRALVEQLLARPAS